MAVKSIKVRDVEISILKLTIEDIAKWCIDNDKYDWLEDALTNGFTIKRNPSKEHPEGFVEKVEKPTFLDVRRHFLMTFFPATIAEPKPKVSMLDKIRAIKVEE